MPARFLGVCVCQPCLSAPKQVKGENRKRTEGHESVSARLNQWLTWRGNTAVETVCETCDNSVKERRPGVTFLHWTDHGDVDFDSVVRRWAGPPGRSASSVP